jgi:uncharacterized membrane protein YgcG
MSLAAALRDVGTPVTDQALVLNYLRDPNPRFADITTIVTMQSPLPTFAHTRSLLALRETQLANSVQTGANTAFYGASSHGAGSSSGNRGGDRGDGNRNDGGGNRNGGGGSYYCWKRRTAGATMIAPILAAAPPQSGPGCA